MPSPALRVLTWNVWWRFGPWSERQAALTSVLRHEQPDVVGLQEVWVEQDGRNQAAELAGALGHHWATTPPRFRDGLAFVNAVISRWPLRDIETAVLPRADGTPSHRQALLADVDAPFGRLLFVTTHLDWQFDASATRLAQAVAVARLVAEVKRRNSTSIEPTAEAEAEWVRIMSLPNAMTEYQKVCTPGYYNGEGQNTGIGFVGTQYPQGAPSFFKMLARWREQGDCQGLVIR